MLCLFAQKVVLTMEKPNIGISTAECGLKAGRREFEALLCLNVLQQFTKKCVLQQNNLSASSSREKGEIDNSILVLLKVLDGNTSKYCLATLPLGYVIG